MNQTKCKTRKIYQFSGKKHYKVGKIGKFGCEILKNAENISM